jgi:hypothetical protein
MAESQKERKIMSLDKAILADKKYGLVIHAPVGSEGEQQAICYFDSEQPFPTFQKGDIIDPRIWQGESYKMYRRSFKDGDLLRVNAVHHLIAPDITDDYRSHIISILTNWLKNNETNLRH